MASKSKAVLVVDDDAELLAMVQTVLEWAGHRAVTATDGQDALEKVAQEMPALILLDMKMPGVDGWEFARDFLAKYDRGAPIVVLTAADDARKRAEEIGAQGYLGKPFDIDRLIRIVESYIGKGG